MQDKEFDDIFGAKLNNIEIEPSAQAWAGINAELNGGKRKKILVSILSIAASMVVLITAGLLFISQNGNTVIVKPAKNNLAHNAVNIPTVKPNVKAAAAPGIKTIKAENVNPANGLLVIHQVKKMELAAKPTQKMASATGEIAAIQPVGQPVLAAVSQRPADIIKPVVPDVATPLSVKQMVPADIPDSLSNPGLAIAQQGDKADASAKKRRVCSLGDLMNRVIEKVDKRKDKIIVFSDGDDD